jgi:biopolymer transport protein ExbB
VNVNFNFLHDIVLVLMALLFAVALAVIMERLIYYKFVERSRKRLIAVLGRRNPTELQAELERSAIGPHARMVASVDALKSADPERFDLKVQAVYLSQQGGVRRLLWLVDTAITLSPLLGLLGTILGIIDTFTALASQGVSDPQAVSRGIGTALFATAAGIGIAVFCLVFNNYFNERVERVNEQLKVLALDYAAGA